MSSSISNSNNINTSGTINASVLSSMTPDQVSRIRRLLTQTTDIDKDERYMAMSDCITELEGLADGVQLDVALQLPLSKAILTLLEDQSSDVQTVAVKCLAVLIKKLHLDQITDIIDKLCGLILEQDKAESRDIYCIGLKTIINNAILDQGEIIGNRITNGCINGMKITTANTSNRYTPDEIKEIESALLEVIRDALVRFGSLLTSNHQAILELIVTRLESKSDAVKKRAIQTLSPLVVHLTEKQFTQLMDFVIKKIESADKHASLVYNYLQTIGIVSQAAGVRVGKFINKIVPQLERFCVLESQNDNTAEVNQVLIELWENSMLTYEALITRCPAEIQPFVNNIVNISLQFLKYDPNYSYDDEMGNSGNNNNDKMNDQPSSDNWDDGNDNSWGDDAEENKGVVSMDDNDADDDENWKVRRGAVRCLSAFIRAKSNILNQYYENLCDSLITRFKERDQNVKLAIFNCTIDLLHEAVIQKVSPTSPSNNYETKSSSDSNSMTDIPTPSLTRTRSSYKTLNTRIKPLVEKSLHEAQTRNASTETKSAVISVIKELLLVKQGGLDEFLNLIIPNVLSGVEAEDMRLKSESLHLLKLLIEFHDNKSLNQYLPQISEIANKSVKDNYLKFKSESLRLIAAIVTVLEHDNKKITNDIVLSFYNSVFSQLQLLDVDQEVKEASLNTIAILLSKFGDLFSDKLSSLLPILMQRLTNELTRLSALRCLAKIAQSSLNIDLSLILNSIIDELLVLLRKDSPQLKHETANTLLSIIKSNNGKQLNSNYYGKLLNETAIHINENDLYLSHLVIEVINGIITVNPNLNQSEFIALFNKIFTFLKSPLLQGQALSSLVQLFQTLLICPNIQYPQLVQQLLKVLTDKDYNNQSSLNLALILAGMTKSSSVNSAQFNESIQYFIKSVQDNGEENIQQISLLILGEIGRERDLSSQNNIESVIVNSFQCKSDSVKNAASYALGNLTVGNMKRYLPQLLNLIKTNKEHKYLTLNSLKEVIRRHTVDTQSSGAFNPYVNEIIPILLDDAENSEEEGVRSECAENLGLLTIINTQLLLNKLISLTQSNKPSMRAVAITALRYSLSNQTNIQLIQQHIQTFLILLKDPDLNVHRQCLLTINALAHNNFELIGVELSKTIIPILYQDTTPKPELIRVVDLGPFKHKVDDGLPIRKAAYQCLDTLLSVAAHRLNIRELILELRKGLTDADDIQIQTYELLYKIATNNGEQMLEVLDKLPTDIMKGVKEQLKEAKGENNPERAKDVLRVSVRALYSMSMIQGVEACPEFVEFYQRVLKTALLAKMLEELHGA